VKKLVYNFYYVLFLAISGYHNAGKTILALSLYEILRKKGYKIAVIKSSKEKDVLTDIPKKDTWLYREAGISVENKRKWESLYPKEKFFLLIKKPN